MIRMDCKGKIKESKKRDKYSDLDRELKMLWKMKLTVIPIVVGAFGIVPKGLQRKLEELEWKNRDHPDHCLVIDYVVGILLWLVCLREALGHLRSLHIFIYSFLICNHLVANTSTACYRLCSWNSTLVGVFARSAWSSA